MADPFRLTPFQLRGEIGTPRQWIYCYIEARPTFVPSPKIFARNQRWKLYSDGRLFDISTDVLEKYPVPGNDEIRKTLHEVIDSFPKEGRMIRRSEDNTGKAAKKKDKKGAAETRLERRGKRRRDAKRVNS